MHQRAAHALFLPIGPDGQGPEAERRAPVHGASGADDHLVARRVAGDQGECRQPAAIGPKLLEQLDLGRHRLRRLGADEGGRDEGFDRLEIARLFAPYQHGLVVVGGASSSRSAAVSPAGSEG